MNDRRAATARHPVKVKSLDERQFKPGVTNSNPARRHWKRGIRSIEFAASHHAFTTWKVCDRDGE